MYLFFKLIKALKEPRFDNNEWCLIAEIYPKLKDKNVAAFDSEFLKHHTPNKAITEFMRLWFLIVGELQELNALMDDTLTEDDRLLITSSLLANDNTLLRMTAQKIEWLARVSIKCAPTNDLLRHFLHAVSYRIRQLENQPITPRQSSVDQARLQNIVENIYKHMLIKKLKYFCIEYMDSIIANVELYLKHDKLCFLYYSVGGKAIHIPTLIKNELEAILYDASHTNLTPTLHLLFKKYIRVDDLINILNGTIKYLDSYSIRIVNDAPEDERLLAFADSFEGYVDLFQIRIHDSTYSLFGNSYTNEALEDEFIQTCRLIADQVHSQSVRLSI